MYTRIEGVGGGDKIKFSKFYQTRSVKKNLFILGWGSENTISNIFCDGLPDAVVEYVVDEEGGEPPTHGLHPTLKR